MNSIEVIWWGGARGMWDQGMLIHAVEGRLAPNTVQYVEQYKWNTPSTPPKSVGCILIVPGATGDVGAVKLFVDRLKWCVLVVSSDEENLFPIQVFKAPNRIIWRQHPVPQRFGFEADRVFPTGWRQDTIETIVKVGLVPKSVLFTYCGQVNNPNRLECVGVLHKMTTPNIVKISDGFGRGMDYPVYLHALKSAKLAPSPAGLHNTDCFRIFEALECGTLPVVAIRPDSHPPGFNYWAQMTKGGVPFPLIEDWQQFPDIARRYDVDEAAYKRDLMLALAWWDDYKKKFACDLAGDAVELEARTSSC